MSGAVREGNDSGDTLFEANRLDLNEPRCIGRFKATELVHGGFLFIVEALLSGEMHHHMITEVAAWRMRG